MVYKRDPKERIIKTKECEMCGNKVYVIGTTSIDSYHMRTVFNARKEIHSGQCDGGENRYIEDFERRLQESYKISDEQKEWFNQCWDRL